MELGLVLEGLDAEQTLAVTSPGAPLAIVAPAGSGKTRVLTRRIARRVADGSADASHVLAITFTRRAAAELVGRLSALGLRSQPTIGTFHGVAWGVLRRRWADQHLRRPPDLLAEPEHLLADLPEVAAVRGGRRAPATDVAAEIAWAHARLVPPDRYQRAAMVAGRRPPGGPAAIAAAYAAYEKAKKARRLVDFDDLLGLVVRDITRDGTFAEVQRWRFRHLFVDEFQDVNPLQYALLEAWRGGRNDLCVVGDVNQAIYGWNGAEAAWIRDFASHHPGATIVRLSRNYRSTPEIVAAATSVLGPLGGGSDVEAVHPVGGPPVVHAYEDETAEAAGVARLLRGERVPGRRWSAFGVLVRTHAQVPLIERALRAVGIPVRARGARPLLASGPVRAALDAASTTGLRTFVDDLAADVADGVAAPGLAPLVPLGRQLLSTDPAATVTSFRAWLALNAPGDDGDEDGDAVDIVTFHARRRDRRRGARPRPPRRRVERGRTRGGNAVVARRPDASGAARPPHVGPTAQRRLPVAVAAPGPTRGRPGGARSTATSAAPPRRDATRSGSGCATGVAAFRLTGDRTPRADDLHRRGARRDRPGSPRYARRPGRTPRGGPDGGQTAGPPAAARAGRRPTGLSVSRRGR
jgi:DNA helicase-2/ATP-dependent DNA helicase PcrA